MILWGEVGRVMEACEHQAEELRICPGDTAELWRVPRGGSRVRTGFRKISLAIL